MFTKFPPPAGVIQLRLTLQQTVKESAAFPGEVMSIDASKAEKSLPKSVNVTRKIEALRFESPTDIVFNHDGTLAYVTDAGSEDGVVVFKRDAATGLLTEVIQKLRRENSFGKSIDVGNEAAIRPSAGTLSDGNIVILDEPFTQRITHYGTYHFQASGASQITPLLLKPLTEDDHTDPDSLNQWQIVATGKQRTIPGAGEYEFEFGLTGGSVVGQQGLYFGWLDGGDGANTVVKASLNTSSSAFQLVSAEMSNAIQISSTSTSAHYASGHAYSMDANFEVTEVKGLDNPQSIAISSDGKKLFSGDQAGVIATWDQQLDGTYRLATAEAWFQEERLEFLGGLAPNVRFDNARNLRVEADPSLKGSLSSRELSSRPIAYAGDLAFFADMEALEASEIDAKRPRDNGKTQVIKNAAGEILAKIADGFTSLSVGSASNTHFDFDGDIAALATNGQYLMVGLPGTDRLLDPLYKSDPDDAGAVVVYKIAEDGSLTLSQYLTAFPHDGLASTGQVQGHEFGASIAIHHDTAVIPYLKGGIEAVQVWQVNASGVWELQTPVLSGGFLVDIDRDTIITSSDFDGGEDVKIYRRDLSGTWQPQTFVSGTVLPDAISVSIDGNTASVVGTDGQLHVYRETSAGWKEQAVGISVPTGAVNLQEFVGELGSEPAKVDILFTGFVVHKRNEKENNYWYLTEGVGGAHLNQRVEKNATDGCENYQENPCVTVSLAGLTTQINNISEKIFSLHEEDSDKDDFLGVFQVGSGYFTEKRPSAGSNETDELCTLHITGALCRTDSELTEDGVVKVRYNATLTFDNDAFLSGHKVSTDIMDSLGDLIAIGVKGKGAKGGVEVFSESEQQTGWFPGVGAITGLVVSPDNGTVYGTDDSGKVYVLGDPTAVDVRDVDSLKRTQQQVLFTSPPATLPGPGVRNVQKLIGASSITLSRDGTKVYVTARDSGAVTAFGIDPNNNTLGVATAFGPNSPDDLDGAADSASERFNSQDFLVVANTGANALTTFLLGASDPIADQGPNPNGLNGLGDADPTSNLKKIQSLAANPQPSATPGVKQVFYAVAPRIIPCSSSIRSSSKMLKVMPPKSPKR